MAATGLRPSRRALIQGISLPALAALLRAAEPPDIRATLSYLSSALANGNPSDAMTVFSKSWSLYTQLANYFSVLTTSYEIASEVEINDETTDAEQSDVEATWTLHLTSLSAKTTDRRVEDVRIRLKRSKPGTKSPWRIVAFAPIDLFNPQPPVK